MAELIGDYWYQGLRQPVRFADAVQAAGKRYSAPLFIESSPHPVLTGHVQDGLRASGLAGDAIGSLRRNENSWRRFLLAAAQAYVRGAEVDWSALLGSAPAGALPLPSYPFDRRRYWITDSGSAPSGLGSIEHPLLGAVVQLADNDGYLITGRLSLATLPWLADHAVDGTVLLPGTGFVELAMQAGSLVGCDELVDLTLQSPLVLPEAGATQLQLLVGGPDAAGRRSLTVHSRPADESADWTRHATGLLGSTDSDELTAPSMLTARSAGRRPLPNSTWPTPTTGWPTAATTTGRPSEACAGPGGTSAPATPRSCCRSPRRPTGTRCTRRCWMPRCTCWCWTRSTVPTLPRCCCRSRSTACGSAGPARRNCASGSSGSARTGSACCPGRQRPAGRPAGFAGTAPGRQGGDADR